VTTAQIAFALTIGAVVIAVVASLVSAERRHRAGVLPPSNGAQSA
jgi:hypothetical protein